MLGAYREFVVDTSVVVKFFLEEPDSDKADALLEDHRLGNVRLIAPDFLLIEFANALWRQTSRGDITETEAEDALTAFLDLAPSLEIVPARGLLREILRACRRYNHAAYEVAFLALAERLRIPFVTADERFYEKVHRHSPAAVFLRDL